MDIATMAFAINIRATNATAAPLRVLTAEFQLLKPVSTSTPSDYPPHLTFAIYDSIPEVDLREAVRRVFSQQASILLRFTRLATFEHPNLVFWAAPQASECLTRVHAALHDLIDPVRCHAHYRPGNWVPHCTLAMNVPIAMVTQARILAARPMQPFEVTFETADCVEFHPIRVIEKCILRAA